MDVHKNFAASTVVTPPSPPESGLSLVVAAGEGSRFGSPVNLTVWPPGVAPTIANAEIIRVTSIAGDTLTLSGRAQEFTTARSIAAGWQIADTVTVKLVADLSENVAYTNVANQFLVSQGIAAAPAAVTLNLGNGGAAGALSALQLGGTGIATGQILADPSLNVTLKNVSNGSLVFGTANTARMTIDSIGRTEFTQFVRALSAPITGFPTSGKGLEMYFDGGTDSAALVSYDRGASVFKPLVLYASVVNVSNDVTVARDIYEKGRTAPVGHWIDVPFNAANFAATGGGSWTVGAAAIIHNRYTLIGKTVVWSIYLSWFSGANVLAGAVTSVTIVAPFTPAQATANAVPYVIENGAATGGFYASFSGGYASISKLTGAAIVSGGTPFGMIAVFTYERT